MTPSFSSSSSSSSMGSSSSSTPDSGQDSVKHSEDTASKSKSSKRRARKKAHNSFGRTSVKPGGLRKVDEKTIEEGGVSSDSVSLRKNRRLSSSSSLSPSTDNSNLTVFFLTAPLEENGRGDTDYVTSVIESIKGASVKNFRIEGIHIKGTTENTKGKQLYDVNNVGKPFHDQARIQAVSNLQEYIQWYKNTEKGCTVFLHLQLRAPETGCMVYPTELKTLKVDRFLITCHEWTFNHYLYNGQDRLKQQVAYMEQADHIFFLNEKDRSDAINKNSSFEGKSSVSNVIATMKTKIELLNKADIFEKPPNILIFGYLRKGKGFTEGIKLARVIRNHKNPIAKQIKVFFAGDGSINIMRAIMEEKHPDFIESQYARHCQKQLVFVAIYDVLFKGRNRFEIVDANDRKLEDIIKAMIPEVVGDKGQYFIALCRTQEFIGLKLQDEQKDSLKEKISDILTKNLSQVRRLFGEEHEKRWLIELSQNEGLNEEVNFKLTPERLDDLAKKCRYCFKPEYKEFANNSSSIINAISRGLIVYTFSGPLTDKNFIAGTYKNSVMLYPRPPQQDWISENGSLQSLAAYEVINWVISDIIKKEKEKSMERGEMYDGVADSDVTFRGMQNAVVELFSPEKIRRDYVQQYKVQLER